MLTLQTFSFFKSHGICLLCNPLGLQLWRYLSCYLRLFLFFNLSSFLHTSPAYPWSHTQHPLDIASFGHQYCFIWMTADSHNFSREEMMSMHWFYAHGFGISHIPTLMQIFLDLHTTDIPCDLIQLHKPSEVFNTLTFPWSECPADMSAISKDSIMCSHITHHYTFKYSIQATHMLQHIRRTFTGMHTNILSHFWSFRCTVPHLWIFFLSEACLLRIFDIIHTCPTDCL